MNPKLKKLTAYSVSAAAFLLTAKDGNSQVVYHNIDPDIILSETDSVEIDFNADGVSDLQINFDLYKWSFVTGSGWDSWQALETISIKNFESAISAAGASFYFDVKNLESGAAIGNYGPWNALDTLKLMYIYRNAEVTYLIPDSFYVFYENWFANNQHLGIKFLIDGNYHYGWVRLSINDFSTQYGKIPKLVIQDYAYEATPGATIIINNPTASIAEDLFLNDITDYLNASDFQLSFTKADLPETVSAYRIFLYPYSEPPPSVSFLETLSAELYMEVIPSGLINYDVVLPVNLKDIYGNEYIPASNYRAIILSIADGVFSSQNNVSLPSEFKKCVIINTQAPEVIDITTSSENCNISDFTVSFNPSTDESVIKEYRVFILNHDFIHDYVIGFNNSLLALDSSFYVNVIPNNSSNYNVGFNTDKKIVGDTLPVLFQEYYAAVVTIADSIHATGSDANSSIYYEDYYGEIHGKEVELYCELYPVAPNVEIVGTSETAADISVQLDGPDIKSGLAKYWIYIVPFEEMNDFDIEKAASLATTNFLGKPPDTILNTLMQSNIPDVNGIPLSIEKDYVIFVALVSKSEPQRIALSLPSTKFNLLQGANSINNNFFISDNILNIRSFENLPFKLEIYSLTGELIELYEITSRDTAIDLNHFSKGIYIVKSNSNENISITKFFIGHSGY